jgi:hypothetical protein
VAAELQVARWVRDSSPIEELLITDAEESNSVEKFKSSIEELDLVEFLVAQVASLSSCRSHCGGGM